MELKRRKRWFTTTLIIFFWVFLPVSAGPVNYINKVCIDSSPSINPDYFWIPLGCDAPDCCPGCPSSPIDWHLRLTGNAVESVILRFENLPTGAVSNLKIEGNASWLDGNSLRVGKGEATLRSFAVDPQAPVPIAIPQINLNVQEVVDTAIVEFQVVQLIGQVAVNESRIFYQFQQCSSPSNLEASNTEATEPDRIILKNNTGMDNAVILLAGRLSGGCISDRIFRGTGDIPIGNMLSNSAACQSQVAVFSDDNAMALVSDITQWTDATGNELPIALSSPLQIHVTVWLARPGSRSRAETDIVNANLRFNSNNAGIAFVADYQDVSGVSGGTPIGNDKDCLSLDDIQKSPYYAKDRLNVYYTNGPFTGVTCFENAAVLFIGTTSLDQTLTHEFGHSFSLGHVRAPDFGSNNLMWPNVSSRTDFSVGQAFRMNVNCNSTVNRIVQTRPTLMCQPIAMNPSACPSPVPCPSLGLNVVPK